MTNDQAEMTNESVGGNMTERAEVTTSTRTEYNLAERTARFGEGIIRFARTIKRDDVTGPLIRQLVRAGTSIGANYTEADEAGSRKEFDFRISLCCRESRETQYWLRMIAAAADATADAARKQWFEAKELTLIFGAIQRSSKQATPNKKQPPK
jgi:four helix bundle protein